MTESGQMLINDALLGVISIEEVKEKAIQLQQTAEYLEMVYFAVSQAQSEMHEPQNEEEAMEQQRQIKTIKILQVQRILCQDEKDELETFFELVDNENFRPPFMKLMKHEIE